MREVWKNVLLGVLVVSVHTAQAQTAAESAVTSSSSRMSRQTASAPTFTLARPLKPSAPVQSSVNPTPSPHILERGGLPPDEVNRKEFEDNSGERGGKLLLRSGPSGADIFINDLFVGRTPLLIMLAPGPYKIDMRGARDDSGHANVAVMPKATRTVEIDLKQRYPSSISLR
jgi:PEGA domain